VLHAADDHVTVDDGRIISVTPRAAFLLYFQFGRKAQKRLGATGLERVLYPRDPSTKRQPRPDAGPDMITPR
jgi:hypothetical protein